MSTPFALNLAAAPLVSGLPVAPQDLSTGAIDPHALSELVSRSATFESKPIAIPECARKAPPNERPKIRNDIVVIQIWTAPSKNTPKGKLECSFSTTVNVREYDCKNEKLAQTLKELYKGGEHDNKQISFDSWRNKETEKFILTNLEDAKYFAHEFLDGYFKDATLVINLVAKDWESESQDPINKWVQDNVYFLSEYVAKMEELQEEIFTTFGIKGVLDVHVGPHYKIDWKQVRKMPERYPVREGRSKRDHGKMVELQSDDCSDASEQEEEEEPDEMIDDFDTEEELAAAARKAAKKARKE